MGRYWTYCDLCGKAVHYKPETFETKDSMSRELDIRVDEHQLHLCKICDKKFATCDGNPIFGECVGKDNVVECDSYGLPDRCAVQKGKGKSDVLADYQIEAKDDMFS